jgi:putative transposase
MKLRYQFRIYPTSEQQIALAQLFGCCRVVWNDALAHCLKVYQEGEKKPKSDQDLQNFQDYRINPENSVNLVNHGQNWLGEVSNIPLQQSISNLEQAYSNFFNSCKGKRKGKKINPPRFKKRKSRQSAHFTRGGFKLRENGKVYIAKIGEVKTIWSRELPAIPSSMTVIKDSADRYFVSFVVASEVEKLPENNNSVGIDLGISHFAVFNNGEKIEAPKPLKKKLKRLRKLQRKYSRKQKGSKRREGYRKKVAKLHAKIKDTRNDFLHKLSTKIIRENQTIVLEDLAVSNMIKNRKLSRAISDLGWRAFRTMLEAKSVMYGRDFRVIDRWTPTSQTCSECGFKGGKRELNVREWTCLNCGAIHDRDVNAAKNILVAGGQSETLNGRGEKVRLSVKKAHLGEASTAIKPKQLSLF